MRISDWSSDVCSSDLGEGVHQPALYDMANAGSLLVALLVLRRRPRWDGFLILVFAAWYGAGRFLEDFFRIDDTVALGLSGSQLSALPLVVVAGGWLAFVRRTPGLDPAGHPAAEAEVDRRSVG